MVLVVSDLTLWILARQTSLGCDSMGREDLNLNMEPRRCGNDGLLLQLLKLGSEKKRATIFCGTLVVNSCILCQRMDMYRVVCVQVSR